MKKIETAHAPAASGPYSQAVALESGKRLLFVSGQLPIDPNTGKVIEGDIATLTARVLDNMEAILRAAGSELKKVLRVEVFLIDLNTDFAEMNEVYHQYFDFEVAPARQTLQVAGLPLGVRIEISCIAWI